MAPKDILTKELLEREYVKNRKSVGTIASELGIKSQNSVSQALKRHGLSRRSVKDSSHILTKEYLEEHYVRQNKSLKTIVEEIGFKRKSIVSEALKKHGITQREHTKSDKLVKGYERQKSHHTISGNYFSSIRSGAKNRGLCFDITISDAWEIFESQDGKCALSGLSLCFRTTGKNKNIQTASLDRIDSDLGYTYDNVQWVHKDVNKMKMDIPEDRLLELCELITLRNKGGVL